MNSNQIKPRRAFLKKSLSDTLSMSAGLAFTASLLSSKPAHSEDLGPGHFLQTASTEKDFRMGVIGPAELSLVTSRIAVEKAMNKNAKEFAGFELAEAIAVTTVLKDLKTPVPAPDAKAEATLEKIKGAKAGNDFDKAYIRAQLENHEFLRDLAEDYLKNSMGKTSPEESQTRHLATLALAVFKEHVAITKRIRMELGA